MKNMLSKYVMAIAIFCFYTTSVAQEITSFTLINAEEDIEIGVLADGDSINIPTLNTNEFSIRANTTGEIGSVVFRLDNEIIKAENQPPYALYGITGENYTSWTPEFKTYRITGTVHSLPQGQGAKLNTYSILITFADSVEEVSTGPKMHSLVLINADTDEDIAEITEGAVFILEEIGTSNLNIRAECDSITQSVVFDYQGVENYHTENLIEYAIGANDDDDYRPWTPQLGSNTVTATAYTKDNGAGDSGNSLSFNFKVLDSIPEILIEETPLFALRINSGGEAIMVNDSISFIADTLFLGSSKPYSNLKIQDILETTQDSLYKTERTTNGSLQSFSYNIPVANGEYEIKIHLAEIYWGATGGGSGGEGKRLFNVSIEDQEAFSAYDMNAETDPMTAIIKTFSTTVSDSILNIDFGASVNQPKVSAIEILEVRQNTDPIACEWTTLANSSLNNGAAQSAMVNDKLYLMGEITTDSTRTLATEIYDASIDSWSLGATMPNDIAHTSAVAAADEIWFIAGVEGDSIVTATNQVQVYNTLTNTWSTGPSLPNPVSSGDATYSEGKIHFIGGAQVDSLSTANSHYFLDLENSLAGWQQAAALPDYRTNFTATSVNGKIYAIGGQITQDSLVVNQPFLDEYDAINDSWNRKADLPQGRSHMNPGTIVYGNKILIVGGVSNDSLLNNITEYNVLTDSWTELCHLPLKTAAPSVAIFEDQLIVSNIRAIDSLGNNTISMQLTPEIVVEEPEEETELSVLVYHETGGYRHGSIDAGIAMVTEFGEDLGWKVAATQTSDIFATDSLSTFDVVIWMNTTGENLLTDEEETAFETFIQNGGGFVGVHSATDTYRNGSWSWYNDLVGAIVQVNPYHTPNNTNGIIDIVGEHEAVAHLGTEWSKKDEYYYWERNGGYLYSENIDLLTVRSTGASSYDAARPVTWYKEYDGGRSFYTALGHNASDYEGDEKFRNMLQNAIIWAANKGELTQEEEEEQTVDTTPTENNVIVLFPNPVIDQLFIDTVLLNDVESGDISIYSLDGILMKQKTIKGSDPQISLIELPSGYYAAVLQIGSTSEKHMIFKE